MPQLQQAGAPFVQLPDVPEDNSIPIDESLRSLDAVNLILALLQFVHRNQSPKVKKRYRKKISKLHQQICKDADHFLELDIELQHRTQKVKRLRYCIEFIASLYPGKDVKNYLKDLKPAQESLGQFNDLNVAEAMFKDLVKRKQKVWFILGWIANEKKYILEQAQAHLDSYAKNLTLSGNTENLNFSISHLLSDICQRFSRYYYLPRDRYNCHYAVYAYLGHRPIQSAARYDFP